MQPVKNKEETSEIHPRPQQIVLKKVGDRTFEGFISWLDNSIFITWITVLANKSMKPFLINN